MSDPTPPPLDLDGTYGCLFLVSIFSTALWAVSCLQLWFYIEKYLDTDKLWLKLYTILLWVLSTIYLILVLKFLYIYFIREFGNTAYLDNLPKDIYDSAPFSPAIAAMVQAMFVMRAWNLSNGNYYLTGFLAFTVLAQLIVTVVFLHKLRDFEHLDQLLTVVDYERAMNIIVLFTDTVIAVALIWLLWRRRSGFKKTESLIKKLVMFSIGTGLITGICAIIAFVSAQVAPQTFIYLLINFCMAKLYYNCMLASLNARSALRGNLNSTAGGLSIHLDDLASSTNYRSDGSAGSATLSSNSYRTYQTYKPKPIECRVDIDVNSGGSYRDLNHETSTGDLQKARGMDNSSAV